MTRRVLGHIFNEQTNVSRGPERYSQSVLKGHEKGG